MNHFELVRKDKPQQVVAYACGKCGIVHGDPKRADQCCSPYKCQDCGAETERYTTRCDKCVATRRFEREKAVFHKAEKIALEDYKHDFVWVPQLDQYESVEIVLDEVAAGEVSVSYAYAVKPHPYPKPDAADIAYAMCEEGEMHEDAFDDLDVEGLQKVLDAWYAEQSSHGFIEDRSRVVIFDEALAKEEMGSWK